MPTKKAPKKKLKSKAKTNTVGDGTPKYPRHSVLKALRVPRAILDQNAGKICSDKEAAQFVGVGLNGPFRVELSSAIKYGLLDRPEAGKVGVTDLAKKIIRPQEPKDEIDGYREAALKAPDISSVYQHYRGENIPDNQFFNNALTDKFKIPGDKVGEFTEIFIETLTSAHLIEEHNGKRRILDVSQELAPAGTTDENIKKLGKKAKVESGDSCFVIMPFADPIGSYYQSIYEPAIEKAGMKAVRADTDIFATGKVMDQIWTGINEAKVLVAELTTRNPNVYYELGLSHALEKPVVLISSNEEDVPFDLQHIRVIYYDVNDPFWGDKLIKKVAENILSAINNPEEAIFKTRSTP
ncbi:hypothetical protein [Candidatus Nitronereus thalassa]|uniref:Uncharacterized protein n=1 Tax=Candidatus Nitronereus thalassa TaxID=3020898 RepID=A0ABU3KBE9_9BACT|nr:hypothetical protein [Candidatus Nitronereus thalassa]MDT7043618.1 hypothetical protein [Candidatus Nitronereus thalassa]